MIKEITKAFDDKGFVVLVLSHLGTCDLIVTKKQITIAIILNSKRKLTPREIEFRDIWEKEGVCFSVESVKDVETINDFALRRAEGLKNGLSEVLNGNR